MDSVLTNGELSPNLKEFLGDQVDLSIWDGERNEQATGFLVYGHPHLDGDAMDKLPNLRVISNFGVGVDHIDLDAARQRNVKVGNTPGFVDHATADMTFALLMAAARNVIKGDHHARSKEFDHYDPNILHGQEVHGATLGVIGMGNIGTQVARRAAGFDMTVLYHNRHRNGIAEAKTGAQYRSLENLLRESDFVTLNVPMTSETRNLIGREELALMKPTAVLVNVARGGVVDHEALVDALRNGTIWAAALDVTEPEPLPRDHPLLALENVVIAPHLGSATVQTRRGMAQRTVDNLLAGLRGEELLSSPTSS